jgi:hypothetical protein
VLFIITILLNFKIIGKTINITPDIPSQKKLWAVGSCLFVNLIAFIGISYWDQILFIWYMFLALITSVCVIDRNKHLKVGEVSKKLRVRDSEFERVI